MDDHMPSPVLHIVVVLYRPDAAMLESLIALASRHGNVVAVVNAADAATIGAIAAVDGLTSIVNDRNLGVAVAFNQGLERAFGDGADYVMLLDQDSRPDPALPRALVALAEQFQELGGRVGAIGPVVRDRKRPDAVTLADHESVGPGIARTATLISSGMTIHRNAYRAVGGMWQELFIDHVDHEWSFRAAAAGYAILVATGLPLDHDLGEGGFVLAGRFKPIHRSPVRHFHIVRNTLWLQRRSFIPRRWRWKEALKLAVRIPAYIVFSTDRLATIRAVASGLYRGSGSLPPANYRQ